jgi:hypothetical protein
MRRFSRTRRFPTTPDAAWKVLWTSVLAGVLLVPVLVDARADEKAPLTSGAAAQAETANADTAALRTPDGVTLRDKVYYYQAFNQRDPFQSLISGEFEKSDESDIVDIYGVKLVGVLSGGVVKYAMLENNAGHAFIMKAGDPIRNGNIVSVSDRALIARVSIFGQTSTVTLRLEEKKSKGE